MAMVPVSARIGLLLLLGLAACRKKEAEPPAAYTTVSTVAGASGRGFTDGPASTAQFSLPRGLVADAQGTLYVADHQNNCIRKITAGGQVTTLAGTGAIGLADGAAATASFYWPADLVFDHHGTLYVADYGNDAIRTITPAGLVSTLVGTPTGAAGFTDGPAATARLSGPYGLAIDAQDNLYVADRFNYAIRKITPTGWVSTVAGTGVAGHADGPVATAQLADPVSVALDQYGTVYVADLYRIRKVTSDGQLRTVTGSGLAGYTDGPAGGAQFGVINGLTFDAAGNLYVADGTNHCLRKLSPDGAVSTLAGTAQAGYADGPVAAAQFNLPNGVALNAQGTLYVTERFDRVRKITRQ